MFTPTHEAILLTIRAELRNLSERVETMDGRMTLVIQKEDQIMSALSVAVARIAADITASVAVITNDAASEADNADAVTKLTAAAAALEAAVPAVAAANPSAPAPAAPPAA